MPLLSSRVSHDDSEVVESDRNRCCCNFACCRCCHCCCGRHFLLESTIVLEMCSVINVGNLGELVRKNFIKQTSKKTDFLSKIWRYKCRCLMIHNLISQLSLFCIWVKCALTAMMMVLYLNQRLTYRVVRWLWSQLKKQIIMDSCCSKNNNNNNKLSSQMPNGKTS